MDSKGLIKQHIIRVIIQSAGRNYNTPTTTLAPNHSDHVYMHNTWPYQVIGGSAINGLFSGKVFR